MARFLAGGRRDAKLGTTPSGKAVWLEKHPSEYKGWSSSDHLYAAVLHEANRTPGGIAGAHRMLARRSQPTATKARGARVAHATKSTSEAMVARMIGRRVKSGWHGLADGEIVEWEPFGAGGTDVLVRDVASGHLSWHASHGLTPIDGKGPLPSRSTVREIREAEMKKQLEKIGERWAKEPPPPRVRR